MKHEILITYAGSIEAQTLSHFHGVYYARYVEQ